jgi:hypothetical protein
LSRPNFKKATTTAKRFVGAFYFLKTFTFFGRANFLIFRKLKALCLTDLGSFVADLGFEVTDLG